MLFIYGTTFEEDFHIRPLEDFKNIERCNLFPEDFFLIPFSNMYILETLCIASSKEIVNMNSSFSVCSDQR